MRFEQPQAIWRASNRQAILLAALVVAFLAVFLALPLLHVLAGAFWDRQGFTLHWFARIFGGQTFWWGLGTWMTSAAALGLARGWQRDPPNMRGLVAHGALWGLWPTLIILFGARPNVLSLVVALAVGAAIAWTRPMGTGRRLGRADFSRGIVWAVGAWTLCCLLTGTDNPTSREQSWLANSLVLATTVTLLTMAMALPLAFFTVRFRFWGKTLLSGLLLLPMIMPPFVGAIGMRRLLAKYGSLNLMLSDAGLEEPLDILGGARFWGVVVLEVLHLYPIMYLSLAAALANVDPSLEHAARNLGDSGWRLFRKITLPLMLPGVFAGGSIVFIWSFTDLGTPLIFDYRDVAATRIYYMLREGVSTGEGGRQAYALVVAVLALTLLMFYLTKQVLGTRTYATLLRGSTTTAERTPSPRLRLLIYSYLGGVIFLALLPHLSVIASSFADRWFMTVLPESTTTAHYATAAAHPLSAGSIARSLGYSLASTAIDVVLGLIIAFFAVRSGSRLASWLDGIAMLPLAVPGIVLAFGYVGVFSGVKDTLAGWGTFPAWLGGLVDPKEFPVILLVMSYSVRRLPFMVRAVYAGFQQTSPAYEEASLNLGATAGATLRRITLPLIAANVAAGAILCFSFAMLAVSDSLILAVKREYYPLTKAIYTTFGWLSTGEHVASALGVIGMGILAFSLLLAASFMGRRLGEMFRVG